MWKTSLALFLCVVVRNCHLCSITVCSIDHHRPRHHYRRQRRDCNQGWRHCHSGRAHPADWSAGNDQAPSRHNTHRCDRKVCDPRSHRCSHSLRPVGRYLHAARCGRSSEGAFLRGRTGMDKDAAAGDADAVRRFGRHQRRRHGRSAMDVRSTRSGATRPPTHPASPSPGR